MLTVERTSGRAVADCDSVQRLGSVDATEPRRPRCLACVILSMCTRAHWHLECDSAGELAFGCTILRACSFQDRGIDAASPRPWVHMQTTRAIFLRVARVDVRVKPGAHSCRARPPRLHVLRLLATCATHSVVTAAAVAMPVPVPVAVAVPVPVAVSVSMAVPMIVPVSTTTVAAAASVTNRILLLLLLLRRCNCGPILRPAPRTHHRGPRRTSIICLRLSVRARHSGKSLKGLGIPG